MLFTFVPLALHILTVVAAQEVVYSEAELIAALTLTTKTSSEISNSSDRRTTIRLGPGVYHVQLALTEAHSRLTLEGAGQGTAVLIGTHTIREAVGVTLRRISLAGISPTSPALLLADAVDVEIDNCGVQGGIQVRGGTGHRLHHSRVSNPQGGHCVWIATCGNTSSIPWVPCNISVDNNVITDCFNATGPYAPGSAGVLVGCANRVSITHNHISRTYSWGVRLNDNNYCPTVLNNVRLNRIEEWGLGMHGAGYGQGACMYSYGHWFSPGNIFEYNHCRHGPICIYADDASSGQTFHGNICENITGTIMKINGGHQNRMEGNMFLQSSAQPNGLTCRGMGWVCPLNMSRYKSVYACKNTFFDDGDYPFGRWGKVLLNAHFQQAPWITHWPWYKGWCNYTHFQGQACDPDNKGYDCFMQPTGNVINSTAVVMPIGTRGREPVRWSPCLGTPANCCPDFVCTKDFNSNGSAAMYAGDPGFVDIEHGDLTLRNDSRIFRDLPGFPHVPFTDIGPEAMDGCDIAMRRLCSAFVRRGSACQACVRERLKDASCGRSVVSAYCAIPDEWMGDDDLDGRQPLFNISNVFASHAVLQRGKPVVVWGWVHDANSITSDAVVISAEWVDGNTYRGTVDSVTGLYRLTFPAAEARKHPFDLVFNSSLGGPSVTLAALMLGDVFLCSGQSNMASVHIGAMHNASAIVQAAVDLQDGLRLFTAGSIPGYAKTQSHVPLNHLQRNGHAWQPPLGTASGIGSSNTTLLQFSAACYIMGATLYQEHLSASVPVGLMVSAYGGSSIQAWQSPASVDLCGDTDGKWPSSVLYNSQVHPLTVGPLALAGVYWYQGEEDVGTVARANWYGCALPAMIRGWRSLFRDQSIFWVVQQLHAWALPVSYKDALATFRQAQLKALQLPGVEVATAFDGGDPELAMRGDPVGTVHSRYKTIPARRAALAFAGGYYSESVAYMNPRYADATATRTSHATNSSIRVVVQVQGLGASERLTHVHYESESNSSHCPTERNISIAICDWFAIQIDDTPSSWLNASVMIGDDGHSIVLTAVVGVGRSAIATRFGWNSWPVVTVYSTSGIPLVPWKRPIN